MTPALSDALADLAGAVTCIVVVAAFVLGIWAFDRFM